MDYFSLRLMMRMTREVGILPKVEFLLSSLFSVFLLSFIIFSTVDSCLNPSLKFLFLRNKQKNMMLFQVLVLRVLLLLIREEQTTVAICKH